MVQLSVQKIVNHAIVPNHFHLNHFLMNLSKNVSLNNSSKRCLPLPHEFPWCIFCWMAFFAFITFDSCYNYFYSWLSYTIQQTSQISCFDLFVCKYQILLVAMGILSHCLTQQTLPVQNTIILHHHFRENNKKLLPQHRSEK